MLKLCLYAALAVATGATAVSARAQMTVIGAPSVRVSHSDLNLADAAGYGALTVRVRRAASELCEPIHVSSLRSYVESRRCIRQAVTMAQPQIERAVAMAKRGPLTAAVSTWIKIYASR